MSVVFFEGFNHSDNDAVKLDPYYWTNNNDINTISFSSGRTNNAISIANSNYEDGLSGNRKLDLSNFTSPLASQNAFGIGFWVNAYTLKPESRLLSLHNGSTELMQINIVTTTYSSENDSFGLQVIQNNVVKGTYDFRAVTGATYAIGSFSSGKYFSVNDLYLEFYIDSNTNTINIRVDGIDMINSLNSATTQIDGFSNMDKISLYGTHNNWFTTPRAYDDFYLTSGNSIVDTLLGKDVKIYRLNPNGAVSTTDWTNNPSWADANYILSRNDGDNTYYSTDINDSTALFNMENAPVSTGSVGGVKVITTARKVAADVSFTSVYAPADGETVNSFGPTHTINSNTYKYFNTFLIKNPANNNDWTITDINNIQLGFKKLS